MCYLKWFVVTVVLNIVSGENICYLKEKILNCDQVAPGKISDDKLIVRTNFEEIRTLNFSNATLNTVKRNTLKNYKFLDSLHLVNSHISYIEDEAFRELHRLRKLNMTDNFIKEIKTSMFSPKNTLTELTLSNNLIADLSGFNISYFPRLNYLDISSNRLEFLPVGVIHKLKEVNNFFLIADNNPWNCSHDSWKNYLDDILVNSFCINSSYVPIIKTQRYEAFSDETSEASTYYECLKGCRFHHCVLWIVGSFWIGIIFGNVCKLKRLLFTKPVRYDDKYTQYGDAQLN